MPPCDARLAVPHLRRPTCTTQPRHCPTHGCMVLSHSPRSDSHPQPALWCPTLHMPALGLPPRTLRAPRHQRVPTCPPGSDRPHGPPMPPPSPPGSPHCQPRAPTLPLLRALTTCDIVCHQGCMVKLCGRLLGDDAFLSNAAYVCAPLRAPCGLTCPSRCSTPSVTPSSTCGRTSSGPAPSCTQSVCPHMCAPTHC